MNHPINLKTASLVARDLIRPASTGRGFPLIALALALACFTLPQETLAVSPAPDGGYRNQNTAEGDSALFNLTTGADNTAIGFNALFSNTTGYQNTATGSGALQSNTTGSVNTANGFQALYNNTIGGANTAIGYAALSGNTTAFDNTAVG